MKLDIEISGHIKFCTEELSWEQLKQIKNKYFFKHFGYKNKLEYKLLQTEIEIDGQDFILLPPNKEYLNSILDELNIEYNYIDLRICNTIQDNKLNTGIVLRPEQEKIYSQLKEVDFNALITAKTGFGKTLLSLYIAEQLNTPMLFVASRTNLINNLLKDCAKFKIPEELITKVDKDWLDNPVFTPIMYATTQALSDEVLAVLTNGIGLMVADEVHLAITADETMRRLQQIKPKYRLYLSATPENLKFSGLEKVWLSSNIVTAKEQVDFEINIYNLELIRDSHIHADFHSTQNYYEKKDILYGYEYCEHLARLAAYIVIEEKRGVLIYLEHNDGQEMIADYLRLYGLKVGLLNTNADNKHKKEVIDEFDNGGFDVVVGGTSISAGVSWYRLSTIININITLNKSNLDQLVGRLKRKDDKICVKSKNFIQVTVKGITCFKWSKDKKCLEKYPYIKWHSPIIADIRDDELAIIKGYKKLGIDNGN